jgi:hypothetical protein
LFQDTDTQNEDLRSSSSSKKKKKKKKQAAENNSGGGRTKPKSVFMKVK